MKIARYIFLLGFVLLASTVALKTNNFENRVVEGGDEFGYYVYLPATFIYNDLFDLQQTLKVRKSKKPSTVRKDKDGLFRVGEAPSFEGTSVIKYTYGVSVFQFPGFVAGHLLASMSDDHPADGLSPPYFSAVFVVCILWIALGLWFLGSFLDRFVATSTSNLVLLSLMFATNLWHFSVAGVMMSHGIQFMLWSMLLYATANYWENGRKVKDLVQLAIAIGFICIIRPVEIFCVFIPLFYGLAHVKDTWPRIVSFFSSHKQHLGIAVAAGLLILLPQLLYWHGATGSWLYDSYPNEHFDFKNPRLYMGLFSWKNGLFSYSPILILCIPGLYYLLKAKPVFGLVLISCFAVHAYVSYSWWCWMYINGVGSRIMTDIYPLLAIPFAFLIDHFFKKRPALFLPLLVPCMVMVTFWIWQSQNGILYSEFANLSYMRQILFATEHTTEASVAFDLGHYQNEVEQPTYIYENNFEGDTSVLSVRHLKTMSSTFYPVDRNAEKPLGHLVFPYDSIVPYLDKEFIVIDLDVIVFLQTSDIWNMNSLEFAIFNKKGRERSKFVRLNNKTGSGKERSWGWGKLKTKSPLRISIPHKDEIEPGGRFEVWFKNPPNTRPVYIDNLKIGFADKK